MPIRNASLLLVLTFFWADSAGAYFDIEMRYRTEPDFENLLTSDTVTVDLFFSTDVRGMQLLSVGVVSGEMVTYDVIASQALPLIYPHAYFPFYTKNGSQNGYILYAATGKGFTLLNAVEPSPVAWPDPAPGTNKLNVNFRVDGAATGGTPAIGEDIWLASVVFHLGEGFRASTLSLEIEGRGSILQHAGWDPPTGSEIVTLSAPLTFGVPEPGTGALLALGVAACALANRRRVCGAR